MSVLEPAIEEHIQRQIRLALTKEASNIASITFNISDAQNLYGHSDRVEKHCSLTLSLHHMSNIVIDETQPDLYVVIDRVIQKAVRTLSRKILSKR
ncbi:HPF/RaiA family ribosome-associated protein [Thalassotalea crassostreae]|uniref:HPF/RaiA family ribosome-associated protein n=1 Tax=Thalassotalea crassostreae TaxID=1763536 RepID=UPI0012FD44CF|nr:HPF/RaiA family ribosome-associated protein [Thalassotalea crassostreae]